MRNVSPDREIVTDNERTGNTRLQLFIASVSMAGSKEEFAVLQGHRFIVSGTKRKRIQFVPASRELAPAQTRPAPSMSAGEQYLSIVLKNSTSGAKSSVAHAQTYNLSSSSAANSQENPGYTKCEICKLPINNPRDVANASTRPHESSIAHMVCLEHSNPPSCLDRKRKGLKYLSSYGWDPDSRLGLGTSGEGIRAPIQAKVKNDTVGLGANLKDSVNSSKGKKRVLGARQVRAKEIEDRRERQRLQEIFYGKDHVARYLGTSL